MSYTFIDGYGSIQSADSSVVSGSTLRQAIDIASVLTSVPVTFSGNISASIIGTAPVNVVNTPSVIATIVGNPSISGTVNIGTSPGSVVAFQGGTQITSISGVVNTAGSVVSFQGGAWTTSVVGTVGASVIGNVNMTVTSVATANGGLPLWSPLGSRIQGTADLRVVQGASVAVIAAQGAGVRAYIDHVQVLNFGSSSVLVTIADNTTSILGYTIAPAGGGSNYDTFYRPAANSPITASINGTASVLVSMQGFTSLT